MATVNPKRKKSAKTSVTMPDVRLAGGAGAPAARADAEATLRRLVLANLLFEDLAYIDGESTVGLIQSLVPQVKPATVADLAVEARLEQKLRHVPLLLCREMARHEKHKSLVAETLNKVILRPDELCEFVALYWKDNAGKKTLSAQVKKGLAQAFTRFSEYQLAKWNKKDRAVKLRDVLFLSHAKPQDQEQAAVWKRLAEGKLATPDTWEVGLSAAKTTEEKRRVWERLILEGKLGAFAFLKNLRNMTEAGLDKRLISEGILDIKPTMLLPLDFLKAARYAPGYERELETIMLKCAGQYAKLPGHTVFVVDVSGSMGATLSSRSEFSRMDAASALAVLAAEMSERVSLYATAGNDGTRVHATKALKAYRGFALIEEINRARITLGGGGIFTRQCLEWIESQERSRPDRIVIFSDSQDCDLDRKRLPKPFGRHNYIVDVSAHEHGINYRGVWTAEIAGWSGSFLSYIAAMEGQGVAAAEVEDEA